METHTWTGGSQTPAGVCLEPGTASVQVANLIPGYGCRHPINHLRPHMYTGSAMRNPCHQFAYERKSSPAGILP